MDETKKKVKNAVGMDDQWVTMNSTHVLIDDDGQVAQGPENLKNHIKKSGGYKSKAGQKIPKTNRSYSNAKHARGNNVEYNYGPVYEFEEVESKRPKKYDRLPFYMKSKDYLSPEDRKKIRDTVSSFMKNAREGDVYKCGGGVGSAGGARFKVTTHRGAKALAWLHPDGHYSRPVQMSRTNVEEFIRNGVELEK